MRWLKLAGNEVILVMPYVIHLLYALQNLEHLPVGMVVTSSQRCSLSETLLKTRIKYWQCDQL